MHLDNLITTTLIDADGTRFELTDDLQRWGYVLKRNGGIDKKNNQAIVIFKGPAGTVHSVDNNGTMLEWKNKTWNYVVKDNKLAAGKKLTELGQPNVFAGGTVPRQVIKSGLITSLPEPVKQLLNVNAPVNASTVFKPSTPIDLPKTTPAPMSPIVTQPAVSSPAYVAEKFAPVPPPESTMKAPLTANGPAYIQEGTQVDPAKVGPAEVAPLQAKGLTFSNPFIIGGMVVAVILMVILAKKFGKKSA